jgi:hypothetical protein
LSNALVPNGSPIGLHDGVKKYAAVSAFEDRRCGTNFPDVLRYFFSVNPTPLPRLCIDDIEIGSKHAKHEWNARTRATLPSASGCNGRPHRRSAAQVLADLAGRGPGAGVQRDAPVRLRGGGRLHRLAGPAPMLPHPGFDRPVPLFLRPTRLLILSGDRALSGWAAQRCATGLAAHACRCTCGERPSALRAASGCGAEPGRPCGPGRPA